jgi:hypothetical protein
MIERLALALAAAAVAAPASFGGIVDINPNSSTSSDADASSGGRVNGLAAVPGNNQTFYAASEKGGLFKSTNGGSSWTRLNAFRPTLAWDVEVDPGNIQRVYATAGYDGRATPTFGIQISTNGGATWTHPATADPPSTFSCATANRNTPRAFGIAIRPDATQNVFIGTSCGLAVSTDSGATWTFVDPTPATTASNVWDVVVQSGGPSGQGIVDICGNDGHRRSTDGGTTWSTGSTGLPAGRCSIAASPDESYVLLVAAFDNTIYESDNADAATSTWQGLGSPELSRRQGRIPFVATNQRSNSGSNNIFDLWFGDIGLFRGTCTTPATRPSPDVGSPRCPAGFATVQSPPASAPPAGWAGPFTRSAGAHDDVGDIVFDTQASADRCPVLFSSDGGVHTNTDMSADCHNPNWARSNVGLHALWVWSMSGADQAGNATNEDLYLGNQDNGTFATTNVGASSPTWTNPKCCDTFDLLADSNRSWGVIGNECCFFTGAFNRLERAGVGYTSPSAINLPTGNIPTFAWAKRLTQFGTNNVALITSAGAFFTNNITAGPITWGALGTGVPGGLCGIQSATAGGATTFFVQTGNCDGTGGDQVWSAAGTGGTWQRIDSNDGVTGGFGVFAVDPNNPNRTYASNPSATGPRMLFSTDGGTNWDPDPELTTLMNGNGSFRNTNAYPQPTLVSFDPLNTNVLVAGGFDSGVFVSFDSGANWSLLTDPNAATKPHLPRPRTTYFDNEPTGTTVIYLGTEGRGVWRISLQPPVANANGPYSTIEGTDIKLDASGSTDPDGGTLAFAWDLDNDGLFDDAIGAKPTFDRVGRDGVFPVCVKTTDSDGAFDIACTTVTVSNVAPSFTSLTSNAPKDENTAVTVSGAIIDPGWLDPLSATIDWGDGFSPVQPISGTLENVRPDATFTFTISHVYGDDGAFTAHVCGSDDDSKTCRDIPIQIHNVDPTASIDESSATLVNGIPTFIAHAGGPLAFSARSQDPGSDDLLLSWDWGNGPPAPDVTTTYLVNPPNPDPDPSPTIQPRDVTDTQTHSFGDACLYQIRFSALDDDAGSASDRANVIITGNANKRRPSAYWKNQYRAGFPHAFSTATLQCYLAIAGYASNVFNEARDASTIPKAHTVLRGGGRPTKRLDRELLAVWLNFANGAIEFDEPIDTDGDHIDDATFADTLTTAEIIRLDPTSTRAQIRAQTGILRRINLGRA